MRFEQSAAIDLGQCKRPPASIERQTRKSGIPADNRLQTAIPLATAGSRAVSVGKADRCAYPAVIGQSAEIMMEVPMKCPGQDMQYWKPGDIFETECPKCGGVVEFFKDDPARRCSACGHRFANPKMDFGCAAYCPYAEQCLGDLPPEVVAQQENLFKDRVALEMKRHFGGDFRRIGRAARAARYGEQLAKAEGANVAVVLSAVYLREVGEADPSGSGVSETQDAAAAAIRILSRLRASDALIDGVRAILEDPDAIDAAAALEARIVRDAMHLGEAEALLGRNPEAGRAFMKELSRNFLTASGREAAGRLVAAAGA
jgi:hypothetical protein